MDWMMMPLRRYFDFSGRSRRKEYWMFALGALLSYLIFGMLIAFIYGASKVVSPDGTSPLLWVIITLFVLFTLAMLIPSIAVQVRRFHDQDKSGWMTLLGLIPYAGGIIVLVFMCLEGTRGPNRYGEDPKANERFSA